MRLSKNELKFIRSLTQKKVRQANQKFILEGWRALRELLNSPFEADLVAVLPSYLENGDYKGLLDQVRQRKIPLKEISEKELRQVSETVHAQGVVAVVRQRATQLSSSLIGAAKVILALDTIADPGNVGTILRTADWFGADLVLLGKGTVELYNDKVVRSTVGSLFHVPVVEGIDLGVSLAELKGQGFRIVALSADGKTDLDDVDWGKRNVIVLGAEAQGISKQARSIADVLVRISRFGRAESLNVGVACGIALSQLRKQS
ncbi:MAG: RNA methyltransferase [Bacteroidota bacterium]